MENGIKDKSMKDNYDVIVVGGGHAGCEAALATSRLGFKTLLITINLDYVGWMPCNPAIGGSGKSQVIAEIDALGGEIAVNAEKALSQIRILNTSKGLALQVKRVQCDKRRYSLEMKKTLEQQNNLSLYQSVVESIIVEKNRCIGIKDIYQEDIFSKTVILTTGTYLSSKIHVGLVSYDAGRTGELNSKNLSKNLSELGLYVRRFNTGTTPRIDRKTVNFEKLSIQEGTNQAIRFSFKSKLRVFEHQLPSYLGWTNENTADITKSFLKYQPSNTGLMVKVGPRNCPSLEEKIKWFPDRKRHSFFLEAEGFDTDEMYMAGLNMSVFPHCQEEIIRTIVGLENASIIRPAYAIAYDWIDTSEIKLSLETKKICNLFLAGQINGTTGYDEAAAQGLIAGINATLLIQENDPFILNRSDSYIGIMIDDLVNKKLDEPYRITPSFSEFRLSIREDNADIRLTEIGRKIGLVDNERWNIYQIKKDNLSIGKQLIQEEKLTPKADTLEKLKFLGFPSIHQEFTLKDLLKRPDFTYLMVSMLSESFHSLPLEIKEELEIDSKYEGYIRHEKNEILRLQKLMDTKIPFSIDYENITSLSKDGKQSLTKYIPKTIREAVSLPNIKPSDMITLLSYLKKRTV